MSDKHQAHLRIVDRLKGQAGEVRRLCADLDEVTISRRTIPEKWSVKEVLAHIGRVQQVFEGRLDALLTTENPPIVSYAPEGDPDFDAISKRPASELLQWFEETRGRMLGRLGGLLPADWHRPGRHPDYPNYDVHFCMEYMAHHEAHHMYQMFERRAHLAKAPH
ncbi:MAG TPA: DinB family protein [Thermoanaerobaculia bacterium]